MVRYFLCALLLASPVLADQDEEDFVAANIIGIFYHEMGHALIDHLGLPVFGQEEDAADVASIFLIDVLWEPEVALDLAYGASFGFAAEALLGDASDVAYWDVHGPDEQRFFNTVCVFYGADPDNRAEFADDMGLPEERAEYCPYEYDQAAASWGAALDEMQSTDGYAMDLDLGDADPLLNDLLAEEVAALNADFAWPDPLVVATGPCGEANAFYDPARSEIFFCAEFVDHLRELYQLVR